MNSRRLTIPSAKPNQPCVERSLAQIKPSAGPAASPSAVLCNVYVQFMASALRHSLTATPQVRPMAGPESPAGTNQAKPASLSMSVDRG